MLTIISLPISSLNPAAYNPRRISPRELEKLRASIRRFGFLEPVVVRASDRLVVGGHQRLKAAELEGLAEVPCVEVECSDSDAKTLNLALNKVTGTWDVPKLADLLADLSLAAAPLDATGFEPFEVDRLLGILREQQIDDDLPSPITPRTKPTPSPDPASCPRCGLPQPPAPRTNSKL